MANNIPQFLSEIAKGTGHALCEVRDENTGQMHNLEFDLNGLDSLFERMGLKEPPRRTFCIALVAWLCEPEAMASWLYSQSGQPPTDPRTEKVIEALIMEFSVRKGRA